MKSKILSRSGADSDQRTFVLIFDSGDEVIFGIEAFAEKQSLAASQFTGIGAFKQTLLGYFDWEKKEYQKIPIQEQVEVLSLVGDLTLKDGKPNIHAHVVVGRRDGTAHGGHLLKAYVRLTLEVILTETPKH